MSRRQPESSSANAPRQATTMPGASGRAGRAWPHAAKTPRVGSVINFEYSMRIQALQKCLGLREIEFLVPRLDAQKESIRGRRRETLHIERRMVRRGKP